MKFPRGKGPLISFLTPTRGRPQMLRSHIDTTIDLADDPTSCEFVFKVDADDFATLDLLAERQDNLPQRWADKGASVKVQISPRGRGWRGIYRWLDDMARVSTGDWLSIWNDDAVMGVKGWDSLLANAEVPGSNPRMADVCFLQFVNRPAVLSFSYGACRRKVFDLLGRFSEASLADHWLYEVLTPLRAFHKVAELEMDHLRGFDKDATWFEGPGGSGTGYAEEELKQPEMVAAMIADTEKLRAYLGEV